MNSLQMFTACVVLSISTSSANGIEIYRSGYGGIQQFTESGWSDPLFFTREPIAFGPDGSLYFNNDYAFSKYNITTGELTTLVPRTQTVSDLLYGVAISPSGEVYRSGYGGIQHLTPSGWSDPLFFTREPIAFGPDGSLYFNNDYAFSKYNITTGELTTLVPRTQTVSDLLYGVAIWDSPTMVPIPGAAWLLGSGMLCLIGITKNKTSSATIYL